MVEEAIRSHYHLPEPPTIGRHGETWPCLWDPGICGPYYIIITMEKKENRRVNVQFRTSSESLLPLTSYKVDHHSLSLSLFHN